MPCPNPSRLSLTSKSGIGCAIRSIRFISDHGVLSNHEEDYRRGGVVYPADAPAWSTEPSSHPVSHTGGQPVTIEGVFEITPAGAPAASAPIRVQGCSSNPNLIFEGTATPSGGKLKVTLTSKASQSLPTGAMKMEMKIDWKAWIEGSEVAAGTSGPHFIFVTLGKPIDTLDTLEDVTYGTGDRQHNYPSPPPPGITVKRMEAAMATIARAGAAATTDPHKLAIEVLGLFPDYTVDEKKDAFNNKGGAWILADTLRKPYQCQAIARLARSVMDMVGAAGSRTVVIVWGDPDDDGKPKEADWPTDPGGERKGLRKYRRIGNLACTAGLFAERVVVGTFIDPEANPPNPFEACLKLTANGKTMYYAAGVQDGACETPSDVVRVFWGIAWYCFRQLNLTERQVRLDNRKEGPFAMEIAHVYEKRKPRRGRR